jgi:4-hydroxybenzoate polyprenyltransferase
VRLAIAMLGLQVFIGALNDAVDAPRDAVAKPSKPIAQGLATPRQAVLLAALGGLVGVLLSALSGPAVAAVAVAILALGAAYDLGLSRTAWSWLPLALALPLSPVHAWLGATGDVPAGLVRLVPVAAAAGLLLSLSNGLVDIERDRATGKTGIALRLGQGRAWLADLGLVVALVALALLLIPSIPLGGLAEASPGNGVTLALIQRTGLVVGAIAMATGVVPLRSRAAARRERGWELQALGVAAIGVAWIAGVAAEA